MDNKKKNAAVSSLKLLYISALLLMLGSCGKIHERTFREGPRPKAVTPSLAGMADECAIWADKKNPQNTVLIGNDKSALGSLYVFDLKGKLIHRTPYLNRPVGVSVRYGVKMANGETIDVVGCGLRERNEIKVFKIDPVTRKLIDITSSQKILSGFQDSTYGFCFYKNPSDGQLYAFVSRKKTDDIHQIRLEDDGTGKFKGTLVRQFGRKYQKSFVEGMVADDELGYLYCSDEQSAVLKFHADPRIKESFIRSLAQDDGIRGDREGLALYLKPNGKGYLILSSQGNSTFKIYDRAGDNAFIKTAILHNTWKTDGIAASSIKVPPYFPKGIFAAHNDSDNNFGLFSWEEFSALD